MGGLAGCSGGGDGAGSGSAENDGEESTKTGGDMTLTAWTWSMHRIHMKAMAKEYQKHTIEPVGLPAGQIGELLTTSLQSGEDVPHTPMIKGHLVKEVSKSGALINMDDLMSEYENIAFDVSKSMHKVNDTWYGVPGDLGPTCMIYNVEEFDRVGLPTEPSNVEQELQTWEQFINVGKQYESETGQKFTIHNDDPSNLNHWADTLAVQAGGRFYNQDLEFKFNSNANIRAYKMMKRIHDEVSKHVDAFTPKFYQTLRDGDVAVYGAAPAWIVALWKQNLSERSGDWRVARIPSLGGDTARSGLFGGTPGGIPKIHSDQEIEAAKDFSVFWHLTEKGFNEKLKAGAFPGHDIEGAEILEQGDDFFGGQTYMKKYVQAARECPPTYKTPNSRVAEIRGEVGRKVLNGAPVEETLNQAHSDMVDTMKEDAMTVWEV